MFLFHAHLFPPSWRVRARRQHAAPDFFGWSYDMLVMTKFIAVDEVESPIHHGHRALHIHEHIATNKSARGFLFAPRALFLARTCLRA